MELRQITPEFAVAPQITPEDVAELARMGYRTLINNRPDEEIEAQLDSHTMAEAAAAAGMVYVHLPYYPGAMTPDLVAAFEATMSQIEGPVLAYCRSGTRSSHLWAMSEAGARPIDEIVSLAAKAGYDHSGLVPLLAQHAANR
ncbi:TIGR01244 family sulfur transferase [Sedimentimonas flavescens]|uniref:TIGR01244 family sulfur transferase n=1 Tax=Sedimentimonas flavescens TaxID=2851012 RepID=A0ABT2ZX77_9RHOB|nr:TIGR01244 family sulfur transferase [Sedimentimonas flavescens]MCV2878354.1 TIGR01244 family sulfur transferase [Sedimentimonas flavescens]